MESRFVLNFCYEHISLIYTPTIYSLTSRQNTGLSLFTNDYNYPRIEDDPTQKGQEKEPYEPPKF